MQNNKKKKKKKKKRRKDGTGLVPVGHKHLIRGLQSESMYSTKR